MEYLQCFEEYRQEYKRFLLQILLLAQHVSGITMPIIRSPRVLCSGCCVWYFCAVVFQVAGLMWSWGLCVRFAGCWFTGSVEPVNQHPANRTHNPQLHTRPATWKTTAQKYHTQQPLYNTLGLLMMGMVMPETCWASNKICKKASVASSWHFISTHRKEFVRHVGHLPRKYIKLARACFWSPSKSMNGI